MKAAWYEATGPAKDVLKVGPQPDPEPGQGEVRVRMATSGVNPSDVKRRAGSHIGGAALPWTIPNNDGAGTIDKVGAGVDAGRVGQRVWLHGTGWKRPWGTASEYTVLSAKRAVPLPQGISFEVAAGLGVPAMTAHRAVFGLGPVKGKTILVTGGAGAVGFYAIQLAVWGGAQVIATVSGNEKQAEALRAGAHHVVNYRTEDVADRVMAITGGQGVDHIVEVDFGANLPTTLKVIKDNGSIGTYASAGNREPTIPFYALMFKNIRLMWVMVYDMAPEAMDDAARDINEWLVRGNPQHPRYHHFPLEQIAQAHLAVEAGAIGKVVVDVSGS